MTTMALLQTGQTLPWQHILGDLEGFGVVVPKPVRDAHHALDAVIAATTKQDTAADIANNTVPSTDNAAQLVADMALAYVIAHALPDVAGLIIPVAQRRVIKALVADGEKITATLGAYFEANLAQTYLDATRHFTHSDQPHRVLEAGADAAAAFHAVRAANGVWQRLNNVRVTIGQLSGREENLAALWTGDDDKLDEDELAVINAMIGQEGASAPQLAAERRHRPRCNTLAQTAEVIRNAAQRQRDKRQREQDAGALVPQRRRDGFG